MGGPYHGALRLVTIVVAAVCAVVIHAQDGSVGIGTTVPDASALLDLTSTRKGLLMPRMTTAERDAILLPARGLMVFNSTSMRFEYNAGTALTPVWQPLLATTDATGVIGDVLTSQGPGLPATWTSLADLVDERAWRMGGNANPVSTILGNLRTTGDVDLSIRAGNATLIYLDGTAGRIALRGPVSIDGDTSPLTLSGTVGSVGDIMVSKGAGKTPSWVAAQELPVWSLLGNTGLGASATLGTTDTASLRITTNGRERIHVRGTDGSVRIDALAGAPSANSAQHQTGVLIADADGRLLKVDAEALRRMTGVYSGRYVNTSAETQFNVVVTLPAGAQIDQEASITVTPEGATSVSISPFIVRSSRMVDRFTISFPGGLDPGEAVNWMVVER